MLGMYVWQRHMIYIPAYQTPKPGDYHAQDMQIISLNTEDGVQLKSWYKPAHLGKPTLLYLHGNAGHIGYRMPLAREFIKDGFGVLLLEYRGYGGNPGSPTEQGLYADGRAAMQFLIQQRVQPKQLILYGESLGTGVATQLAVQYPVCAVILQSPFTSLTAVARYHYPWNLIKPWDKFDSLTRIKSINAPLLVLHGKQDRVVPYTQGFRLYNEAIEPKKMAEFAHGDHFNIWSMEQFENEVFQFIKRYCF